MKSLLGFAALAFAATAHAFSFDDIQNWTGTGSHRAALVIDWNDGQSPESFVWGYRWDGAATGATMFQAVVAADAALTADLANYGSASQPNLFANQIAYGSHNQTASGDSYWAYYNADQGSSLPTHWDYANTGMSDRTLVDGSWDGWSFGTYPNETTPSTPVAAPVPEPASLIAVGLGLVALRRRS